MDNNKDKERKTVVRAYFEKINNGTLDDEYFNLFTEEVEIYYPKFGFDKGREGLARFGNKIKNLIASLHFEIEKFNYIISGNYVVVEGFEKGTTTKGLEFPDNITSYGKFCTVFEFKKNQIKRMHCCVDPDFASEDTERLTLLNNEYIKVEKKKTFPDTRAVVEEFYDIQLERKKGNIVDLFADEVDWDLPGNKDKFPWVGKRQTKKEIEQFFRDLYNNIKSEKFNVDFISISGENATAVGELSSNILKYNKLFNTAFVVIFKIVEGEIVKYHFLEDSYKLNEEMV